MNGIDALDLFNFRRLSPILTTSGQPDEAAFAAMAADGVATVINLALGDSPRALPDEGATLAALGIDYVHIPVAFDSPGEAAFAAFVEAYEAARDRPLHVHCVANYRVSAFFYRYRRDRLGWDEAAARRDLDAVWSPDPVWRAFIGDPVRDAPRLAASEARWP